MLLEVTSLSIRYENGRVGLDRVSFGIESGQTVALAGHSGSGKTTAALAIMGLLPPSCTIEGSIRFQGRELIGMAGEELQSLRGSSLSLVWQEPSSALNPVLTVEAQIGEVVRAHHTWPAARRREAIFAMLSKVGLNDPRIRNAYPHQLSGGQMQRVILAQALICNPALLLADEPAASLDTASQNAILDLLRQLKQTTDLSMLFITHNEALLPDLADRVIRLERGRIIAG